ncbi:MAG: guanine deaminase [Cyanobacteria bacterium REEB67]|nr:guanine deaminase [Cyanobacteria bacterium REEB67]
MQPLNEKSAEPITAYLGHVISPLSETEYLDFRQGALLVGADGKILAVGNWADLQIRADLSAYFAGGAAAGLLTIVDCGERLLLPGLVDLHLHLPQVTQTGRSGQHLLTWLNRYIFPSEARFSDTEHARKIAQWFFNELGRNGTTLACVMTTIHKAATDAAFEVAAANGNRVIMGKVMMVANSPEALTENADQSVSQSRELATKWHGYDNNRLLYAFTPRFAISVTADLLAAVSRLQDEFPGSYFHTHLAESLEEIQFVAEQYPQSRSYLDVYDRAGNLGRRSIFAHSIHLDDEDIDRVKKTESSLAHCPSSNFFLKSGVFPYQKMQEAGVLFGLGSDVAAGPAMSMFCVMKDAEFTQPTYWIDPRELLYRATLGGAKAAWLDDQVGSLEEGKEADFIIVDPRRKTGIVDNILSQPSDEILASLVFLGDDRLIEATYVRGKAIYQSTTALSLASSAKLG